MTIRLPLSVLAYSAALIGLSACGSSDSASDTSGADTTSGTAIETPDQPKEAMADKTPTSDAALDTVLAGAHRSDDERARDSHRNPKETLLFFGVTPDLTVAELFPGRGWYTKVIAPYMASGSGEYVAIHFNPGDNERRLAGLNTFQEAFADQDVYGDIKTGLIGGDSPMIEPGSADVVLTFRNVHNWMAGDLADDFFAEFYKALKPGGVLGVVEHRGDPNVEQDPSARTGYVREDTVIAMAEAAGFELEARSQINANLADTRDHPFGVWTLPPVKRSSATREPDPDFDRSKYDAIGESDRMTLKFRKPVDSEGALLE